jgi:hypothetical protein
MLGELPTFFDGRTSRSWHVRVKARFEERQDYTNRQTVPRIIGQRRNPMAKKRQLKRERAAAAAALQSASAPAPEPIPEPPPAPPPPPKKSAAERREEKRARAARPPKREPAKPIPKASSTSYRGRVMSSQVSKLARPLDEQKGPR